MRGRRVHGGGGGVWQGACMEGGMRGRGACVTRKMAIAAGGTHPTGMHSCDKCHCHICFV